MMNSETQQLIDEQMAQLPQNSRDAIKASGWEEKLRTIGYRHGLLLDEIEKLYAETLLVMIGLGDPNMYDINVAQHVEIDDSLAKKIVFDVMHEIFEPIYEDIMKRSESETEEHHELFTEKTPGNSLEKEKESFDAHPKRDDVLQAIETPEKATSSMSKLKLSDIFVKKEGNSTHTPEQVHELRTTLHAQGKGGEETVTTLESEPSTHPEEYQSKDHDPYLEPID